MITKWVEEEVGVAGLDLNPNYKAQFQLNYNTQTRSFNSHLSGIGNVRGKNKDYFVDYDIPITSNRCYGMTIQDKKGQNEFTLVNQLIQGQFADNVEHNIEQFVLHAKTDNINSIIYPTCSKVTITSEILPTNYIGNKKANSKWSISKYASCAIVLKTIKTILLNGEGESTLSFTNPISFFNSEKKLEEEFSFYDGFDIVIEDLVNSELPCVVEANRVETIEEFDYHFNSILSTLESLSKTNKEHKVQGYNINATAIYERLKVVIKQLTKAQLQYVYEKFEISKLGKWGAQKTIVPNQNWSIDNVLSSKKKTEMSKINFLAPKFVYSTFSTSSIGFIGADLVRDKNVGAILPKGLMLYGHVNYLPTLKEGSAHYIKAFSEITYLYNNTYQQNPVSWDSWVVFNQSEVKLNVNASDTYAYIDEFTQLSGLYFTLSEKSKPEFTFSSKCDVTYNSFNLSFWNNNFYSPEHSAIFMDGVLENSVNIFVGHQPLVFEKLETTFSSEWSTIRNPFSFSAQLSKRTISPVVYLSSNSAIGFLVDLQNNDHSKLSNGTEIKTKTAKKQQLNLDSLFNRMVNKNFKTNFITPQLLENDIMLQPLSNLNVTIDFVKQDMNIEANRDSNVFGQASSLVYIKNEKITSTIFKQMGTAIANRVKPPHVYVLPSYYIALSDLLIEIGNNMAIQERAIMSELVLNAAEQRGVINGLDINSATFDYELGTDISIIEVFGRLKTFLSNNTLYDLSKLVSCEKLIRSQQKQPKSVVQRYNGNKDIKKLNLPNFEVIIELIEKALKLNPLVPEIVPEHWGEWIAVEKMDLTDQWDIKTNLEGFQSFPNIETMHQSFVTATHQFIFKMDLLEYNEAYYLNVERGVSFYSLAKIENVKQVDAMNGMMLTSDNSVKNLLQLQANFKENLVESVFQFSQYGKALHLSTDVSLDGWRLYFQLNQPQPWTLKGEFNINFKQTPFIQLVSGIINNDNIKFEFSKIDNKHDTLPVGDYGLPVSNRLMKGSWNKGNKAWELSCAGNMDIAMGVHFLPIEIRCNNNNNNIVMKSSQSYNCARDSNCITPEIIREYLLKPRDYPFNQQIMKVLENSSFKTADLIFDTKQAAMVFHAESVFETESKTHNVDVIIAPSELKEDNTTRFPWGITISSELHTGIVNEFPSLKRLSDLTVSNEIIHLTTIHNSALLAQHDLGGQHWLSRGEQAGQNIISGVHIGGTLALSGSTSLNKIEKWTQLQKLDFHIPIDNFEKFILVLDFPSNNHYKLFEGVLVNPHNLNLHVGDVITYSLNSTVTLRLGETENDIMETNGVIIIDEQGHVSYNASEKQKWVNPYGAVGVEVENLGCSFKNNGLSDSNWLLNVNGNITIGSFTGSASLLVDVKNITKYSVLKGYMESISMKTLSSEMFDKQLQHNTTLLTMDSIYFNSATVTITEMNSGSKTINGIEYPEAMNIKSNLDYYSNSDLDSNVLIKPAKGMWLSGSAGLAKFGQNTDTVVIENPKVSGEFLIGKPSKGLELKGLTRLQNKTWDSEYILEDIGIHGVVHFEQEGLHYTLEITSGAGGGRAGQGIKGMTVKGTVTESDLQFLSKDLKNKLSTFDLLLDKKVIELEKLSKTTNSEYEKLDSDCSNSMNSYMVGKLKDMNINNVNGKDKSFAYVAGMTGIETVEELKCSENLLKNETYYNPKTDHYLTWLSSPTMPSLSTLIGVHNYTTQMKVGAYQQIQNHSSIIKTIYKQFNDEYYSFNQSKFSKQFLDQPTVLLKQQKAVKGCYLHLYEESLSQSLNVSMGVKKLLSFFNGSYSISNVYKEVVEVKMENNELKYKDACADMSSDKKNWVHDQHEFYDADEHLKCINEHLEKVKGAYNSQNSPIPKDLEDKVNEACMKHHLANAGQSLCMEGVQKSIPNKNQMKTYKNTSMFKINFPNVPLQTYWVEAGNNIKTTEFTVFKPKIGVFDAKWKDLVSGKNIRMSLDAVVANKESTIPFYLNVTNIHQASEDIVEILVKTLTSFDTSLFKENQPKVVTKRSVGDLQDLAEANERLYADRKVKWGQERERRATQKIKSILNSQRRIHSEL